MNLEIDKKRTALVVIDLQNGIVGRPTQPYSAESIVANAAKLAEAFRKNKMQVFLVRVSASPDGKDRLSPILDEENKMNTGQLPPDWSNIVKELGPKETDHIITKKQWGAFYGTDLDLQLRRRNIDTIVLCGISTNIGVESTARFAYEYGYQQIFAEDAMGSGKSAEDHTHTVTSNFPRMGRVRKTQEILDILS